MEKALGLLEAVILSGLQALSLRLGPWVNDIIEEKHYVTLFVVVDAFEGKPLAKEPDKCEHWDWFEWDALPSPLFAPVQSVLPKIRGFVK
jgi:8-oxo-dGTP diphosphatase